MKKIIFGLFILLAMDIPAFTPRRLSIRARRLRSSQELPREASMMLMRAS